jgi:alkylation response protein AidB-like acyl-CoA dehydrogenase
MSGHYKSNVRDLLFNLLEWSPVRDQFGTGAYEDFDPQTVRHIVNEVAALAEGPVAESFAAADREPPVFDAATNSITLPEALHKSYARQRASEWWQLDAIAELGGLSAPRTLRWAISELFAGANPTLQMYMAGPTFAGVLHRNGTPAQQQLAKAIVDRGWGMTMVLTEPDAGSDVGAIRTKAEPQPDGSWHLQGVKRFISGAEHDLVDNIVHLVLARPIGAGPGTKGLSLFVVPKFHIDAQTGEIGARNGAFVTGLEHKMGLRGSVTCELSLGETAEQPAVGWLLGDAHDGIAQMFQIIEHSRMTVGTKAIATLSTGYLNAVEYAKTRIQGFDPAPTRNGAKQRVSIIRHPAVRCSLMLAKAYTEGLRALVCCIGSLQDRIALTAGDQQDPEAQALVGLLLPVLKGVGAERSYEHLGQLLAIFGGSGYLQDYPLEQYVRDTKIDSIYEGTTAIQANDLFARRIVRDSGKAVADLNADIAAFASNVGDAAIKAPADAVATAATVVSEMVSELLSIHRLATGGSAPDAHRAAQHAPVLLMSVGDLMVGYLLVQHAQIAASRLADASLDAAERAFYSGKISVATFFVNTVLLELPGRLGAVKNADDLLWQASDASF